MPYDKVSIERILEELAEAGCIVRYESGGRRFIQVVNFLKHQTPHVREPASTIPALGQPSASTSPAPVQPARSVAVTGSVTVAVTGTEPAAAAFEDEVDVGFRDSYGTLSTAMGSTNITRALAGEMKQIAEDYDLDTINRAIRDCRAKNLKPWPSNVRKQILPSLASANGRPPKPQAQIIREEMERNLADPVWMDARYERLKIESDAYRAAHPDEFPTGKAAS